MATQKERDDYEYKLELYKEEMERHNERSALWNDLSPDEQHHHHRNAEKGALRDWTIGATFLIGVAGYFYFSQHGYIGNTLWLYTGATVVGSGIVLLPLYKIFGRILRGSAIAAVGAGIAYLIIWFIQSQTSGVPSDTVKYAISGVIALLVFLAEFRGAYHASGAPKRPTRPIPPR